jgi:hypothetical protein
MTCEQSETLGRQWLRPAYDRLLEKAHGHGCAQRNEKVKS